jgi:hypothetical protein
MTIKTAGEQSPARIQLKPKIYICSFPKSGTHLLWSILKQYGRPAMEDRPWCGTFADNSWTTRWTDPEKFYGRASLMQPETWCKGHAGHKPEYEDFLQKMGVSMVFALRDLRDVVVSQSYHCVADSDAQFAHPDKEHFRAMTHDERITAIIAGDDKFEGIFERWELYAPWLDVDWVYPVKFEDMIAKPVETTAAMLNYVLTRPAKYYGVPLELEWEYLMEEAREVVGAIYETDKSPTFRKGTSGQWREEFTQEHIDLFKSLDNGWLIKLGYEQDTDWG